MVVVDGRETIRCRERPQHAARTVRVAKSRVLKRLRLEIGDSFE